MASTRTSGTKAATGVRAGPWAGVERRHLAAFAAVARTGTFAAAAHELDRAQSTVSQLVAQLEGMLGHVLLHRRAGSGDVRLTAAGELALVHATRILDGHAAARADLERHAAPGSPVRIGVLGTLGPLLLPPLLREVATASGPSRSATACAPPRVAIREVGSDAELAALVAGGGLELAVGGPPPAGPFAVHRVAEEEYVLAVPGTWLAAREPGGVGTALLGLAPLVDSGDAAVRRELRARGIEPRYVVRAASDGAALALVRAGVAAAVLPGARLDAHDRRVAAATLPGLVAPRVVCVYAHRDRRAPVGAERAVAVARAVYAPPAQDPRRGVA